MLLTPADGKLWYGMSTGPELIWQNITIGINVIFEEILAFTREAHGKAVRG